MMGNARSYFRFRVNKKQKSEMISSPKWLYQSIIITKCENSIDLPHGNEVHASVCGLRVDISSRRLAGNFLVNSNM